MSGRPQLGTAFEAGQTTERLADRARWKKGTGRHRNQSKGITRRTHGAGGSRVLQKGSHRSAEHLELSWLDAVPVRPIFDSWRGLNALIPYTVSRGCGMRRICSATNA
jgi:hypothetical protein